MLDIIVDIAKIALNVGIITTEAISPVVLVKRALRNIKNTGDEALGINLLKLNLLYIRKMV